MYMLVSFVDYYKAFDLAWFRGPIWHFQSATNMLSIIYMGLYASSSWPSYKHEVIPLEILNPYIIYIYIYGVIIVIYYNLYVNCL